MRTDWDVIKSVQRYAALMLGAPWDIRVTLENATPERPYALVTQNGPSMTIGSYGEHSLRKQLAATVHLYPAEGRSRAEVEQVAAELEEVLFAGLRAGVLVQPPVVRRGGVIPLWDFVNDTTGEDNPPRNAPDVATITSWATRSIPDDVNPRLMTVAADMRLAWFRAGAVADRGSTVLSGIKATPVAAEIFDR